MRSQLCLSSLASRIPVRFQEPMRFWNTWGVGGIAKAVMPITSESALAEVRRASSDAGDRLFILGEGSNVLVLDGGIDGWVILLRDDPSPPEIVRSWGNSVEIRVSAGYPLRRLVNWSVRRRLSGLEFAVGIPGTVGGAVAGNAGAQGRSIGDLVSFVRTLEVDGTFSDWGKGDLTFAYRSSPFAGGTFWVTSVGLVLSLSSDGLVRQRLRHFASLRKGQPKNSRTAGCVFKNPPGGSAGLMLDSAGCKGLSVGGAMVSREHANFIENLGDATSDDILKLIDICRSRVRDQFGVNLELEIKVIGDGAL